MIVTDQFEANLVWFGDQPLRPGKRYELRLVPATIKRLPSTGNSDHAGTTFTTTGAQ